MRGMGEAAEFALSLQLLLVLLLGPCERGLRESRRARARLAVRWGERKS